ncbi:hypothetical protein [Luteimonas sp. e5]
MNTYMRCIVGLLLGVAVALPAVASQDDAKSGADPAIAAQLKVLDYKHQVDDDGDYRLVFSVDDAGERTQLVFIRSAVEKFMDYQVREIWSPGYRLVDGELPAAVGRRLLEASWMDKLGGWSISQGHAIYVIRIPADADKAVLEAALAAAVASADAIEAELTPGKDEF